MDIEGVVRKVSRIGWFSSSVLFLLLVSLLLLSVKDYSFWQISIYEKMIQTMEIYFGTVCLLQVALYLSIRYAVAKGIVSENLRMQIAGTQSVALSAWLMYAMFFGLAPTPASVSVKLVLSTSLAFTILVGLRAYSPQDTRIVELVRRLMKKYASPLALFGGALIVYLSFLSCSLSEWDSFNFAQALESFDLGAHQPHPPGYSLYVFLSRVAYVVAGDRLVALTSVSAVSGALCLLPVYVIVKKMYDHQTALITCLALMSTRMYWLASEKAVTHMFGTFLMTLAVCLLYLGLKGERKYFSMSWPIVGIALGARPSYFPFLGLWLYATLRDRNLKRLPMYLALFVCAVLSWLVPTVLLTGWERFWELIRRQYVYVSANEFVGARYGMQLLERFFFMLGGFISCGFGTPIQLMYAQPRPLGLHDIPSLAILCVLVGLAILAVAPRIRREWSSKKTFLILWTVPYFVVVYLISAPHYPRYMLPIIPPTVIALVATAWSRVKSIRGVKGKPNLKANVLFGLVVALILFSFLNSARLATTIHTTMVPMGQLTRYVKNNCGKNTIVIVFHEYEAFEYRLPGYRYLSAQYDHSQVMEILKNLPKKNQTVLITDTAIRYVLGPEIERLGLEKIEVARFEIDPQVETEQHLIVLYKLQPARPLSG